MNEELHRDLGRHDAQIENLEHDMRDIKKCVHDIKNILSEAKGGWKVLMLIGGLAGGTFGAAVVYILSALGWTSRS